VQEEFSRRCRMPGEVSTTGKQMREMLIGELVAPSRLPSRQIHQTIAPYQAKPWKSTMIHQAGTRRKVVPDELSMRKGGQDASIPRRWIPSRDVQFDAIHTGAFPDCLGLSILRVLAVGESHRTVLAYLSGSRKWMVTSIPDYTYLAVIAVLYR